MERFVSTLNGPLLLAVSRPSPVAASGQAELGRLVVLVFSDGLNGAMTCEEMLFHLINHGTYHRGAIGHALDLAGGKRPADTYSVFVHGIEPERRQGGSGRRF